MFDLIGETLRRLRKERGLTLEDLRTAAGLGRGQLSRIENRKQEATLSTLAKILECQGVSRREFLRRYELVEAEALAVERQESGASAEKEDWPEEVRAVLSKVDSFVHMTLDQPRSVAQGAIEIGDLMVLFRVVPKDAAAPQVKPKGETGELLKSRASKLRTAGKPGRPAASSGRKRKR
ncbi:MAG TPA: helix-turn-helix transcriptional regulator [Thermoanaerobaculia bacterium]|jgi:transcriptional regulator with XRE-family HTH domain|nr:helix-turn-helix transcriptional regulator [Thermoanaerobaculia bacterium]